MPGVWCPPSFRNDLEAMQRSPKAAVLLSVFGGGLKGGAWRHTYHYENCSRREPDSAVVKLPETDE